jgi:CheY-like chemotaxis protein
MTAILREVASTPGWRVLVLDDSIAVGSAVRAMLVGMPQVGEVETAGCAGSALAILRAKSRAAPVDVVLLDVEMSAPGIADHAGGDGLVADPARRHRDHGGTRRWCFGPSLQAERIGGPGAERLR